jgi:hypothetical protein
MTTHLRKNGNLWKLLVEGCSLWVIVRWWKEMKVTVTYGHECYHTPNEVRLLVEGMFVFTLCITTLCLTDFSFLSSHTISHKQKCTSDTKSVLHPN